MTVPNLRAVSLGIAALSLLLALPAAAQQKPQGTPPPGPTTDTSVIDAQGTAHVTRVVPVPKTISPEAQKFLAQPVSDANVPQTLEERRHGTDVWQARAGEEFRNVYPSKVKPGNVAGVPVKFITPETVAPDHADRILINLHGGGFNSDSGSLTETIPVAYLSQTKAIAVLYRLAPEHPFPAAVDDAVAVYKEVLKTHKPKDVAIFGTSAGAILTGEVAVELKKLGLPEPGALGIFSGFGDYSMPADSDALYSLRGFSGHMEIPQPRQPGKDEYVRNTDLKDPVLSPMYADLSGLPPTLFITSTRDMLLSGTCLLQRAFLRAGDDAQLVVFEALPHAFWNDIRLPETKEADTIMARFFAKNLGR